MCSSLSQSISHSLYIGMSVVNPLSLDSSCLFRQCSILKQQQVIRFNRSSSVMEDCRLFTCCHQLVSVRGLASCAGSNQWCCCIISWDQVSQLFGSEGVAFKVCNHLDATVNHDRMKRVHKECFVGIERHVELSTELLNGRHGSGQEVPVTSVCPPCACVPQAGSAGDTGH